MHRCLLVLLCAASVFATISSAQVASQVAPPQSTASAVSTRPVPLATPAAPGVSPLRVPAGSVLAFYLQTRLRPVAEDPLDALPQGTVLHVKVLRPIDSMLDRDGSEFHGWVVSDLALGDGVVIHADAEVRGLLVLLRSKNHPDGFRYELLLTELTDHGQSYPLTASLHPSFFDAPPSSAAAKVAVKESSKSAASGNTKIPVDNHQ